MVKKTLAYLLIAGLIVTGSFVPGQIFPSIGTDTVSAVTAAPKPTPAPAPKPTPAPAPKPTPAPAQAPASGSTGHSQWSSSPSAWAKQEISKAALEGLTTDAILADYNKPITREEFVELIVKLYEASGGKVIVPTSQNPFKDSTNPAIAKAYELGFIAGTGDLKFNPSGLLTRQESAVIMKREWSKLGVQTYFEVKTTVEFVDKAKIATWAKEAMEYMNQAGILVGTSKNLLNPQGLTTREQAIALILRSFEKGKMLGFDAVTSATTAGGAIDTVSSATTSGGGADTVSSATPGGGGGDDDDNDEDDDDDDEGDDD